MSFLSYSPLLKISALSGLGVHKLLPTLGKAIDAYHRRIPTRQLNKLIAEAQAAHASPGGRVLYATQGATDPPTFTLFATRTLPPDLPALPGAPHPGALRVRADPAQAAGPPAGRLNGLREPGVSDTVAS